ncbi:hypothetical protein FHT86_001070 [Rhizobium sp. BK313]|uniref:hypothetical protein n=1 Tax=Rhizobium sp. BK313 TaxID=2587081 RepID=UPI00106100A6|nr:hypothetical protein [Rhizobium sp. BK313]MBB3452814.1 hypothetical protein [Rhizobium sp. BK313]
MDNMTAQENTSAFEPYEYGSLALPVHPLPGEGLADLLFRAVEYNGFHAVNIVDKLMRRTGNSIWSHFSFAKHEFDAGQVAHALGINESYISPLIYRKNNGAINFFGANISPSNLSSRRRVSPLYLREHCYQKAIWSLRCFPCDPVNRETLLEECPECRSPLIFKYTAGVSTCSRCGANLCDFPQTKIELPDEFSFQFVQSLVDPDQTAREARGWRLHEDLRSFSRGALFTLIIELAKLLDFEQRPEWQGADFLASRHYSVSLEALVEASGALLNWPGRFFELSAITEHTKKYTNKQWVHPLTRGIPKYHKDLKVFLQRELTEHFCSGIRRHYRFSSEKEFQSVTYFFPPAVRAQANAIGLPVGEVLGLYKLGTIWCPDDKLRRGLGATGVAPVVDPKEFQSSLEEWAVGRPVVEIVQASRTSRHPWAIVFDAVFRGDVQVTIKRSDRKPFAKCLYTTDETAVTALCQAQTNEIDPETEVTWRDVLFYLRITNGSIPPLQNAGLLPAGKFRMRNVWELQERFISIAEIRSRLLVSDRRLATASIMKSIGRLGLKPIVPGVGIFDRKGGEAFVSDMLI